MDLNLYFKRKRPNFKLLLEYGFKKVDDTYIYETLFFNNDFTAIINIDANGKITGKVIDNMNNEEYTQIFTTLFNGAYVNSVRAEFEKLLNNIANKCFYNVLFYSCQANRITELIYKKYGVEPDFPFKDKTYNKSGTFRHKESAKWFGLIMNINYKLLNKQAENSAVDIINLKINKEDGENLRKINGIYSAYHMNHQNWISVVLNDTLKDEYIMDLVINSFNLT